MPFIPHLLYKVTGMEIKYCIRGLVEFLKGMKPAVRYFMVAGFLIILMRAGDQHMPLSGLAKYRYFEPPPLRFQAFIEYDVMFHFIQADDELLETVRSLVGMFILAL